VHRHYPLDHACNPAVPRPFHRNACRFATAALCAEDQGKFWEMNDALFEGPGVDPLAVAGRLGLDLARWRQCLTAAPTGERLQADLRAGKEAGVRGTPAFLVDGQLFVGHVPQEEIAKRIGAGPTAPAARPRLGAPASAPAAAPAR
jgi:protein-disulfide isomerase